MTAIASSIVRLTAQLLKWFLLMYPTMSNAVWVGNHVSIKYLNYMHATWFPEIDINGGKFLPFTFTTIKT